MLYRVFVSSTFIDLEEYRRAVAEGIRQLGAIDVSMEDFGARDERPKEECLRLVREESDFFVGIYAHRYGFIPDGDEVSITEAEYNQASNVGLPRLIYLVNETIPWSPPFIDEGEAKQRLHRFKQTLQSTHMRQYFSTPDQLRAHVCTDLGREIRKLELKKLSSEPRSLDRTNSNLPRVQQSEDIHYPSLSQEVIKRARKKLRPDNPPDQLLGRRQLQLLEEGHRRLLVGELPMLIHGIPGIGKSAFLATLVSNTEVQEEYEENIFWINLRESTSSSVIEIADEISRGLDYQDALNERNSGPKLRALQAALSSDMPKHLIVFDNADLSEHEEALIQFQQRVTSSMVVGSRTRFAVPDMEPLALRELDPQSAIQMFKIHAKVEADDTQIAPICELIGNHPQAISLAGPGIWLDELTLEELAENLNIKKLEVLSRGVKNSERDMRTSFALSYDNLAAPDERYIFDVLGAFALLGAPLSAIAATTDLPNAWCRRLLARLRSRSLVRQDERDRDNYRTHPLLHEFAREKLSERERLMIRDEARFEDTPTGRLIDYYVRYAKRHTENFPALEVAHDNLLQAAHWSWRNRVWEAVHDLWEALDAWLDGTGNWGNLSTLQERAEQANRNLQNRQSELAKVLVARSAYLDNVGKRSGAMDYAEESLKLGRDVGDRKSVVSGLVQVGEIQAHLNKNVQAHNNFEEAWERCQDIPDWHEVAGVAYHLGHSYWSRGDLAKATELFQECINISRKLDSSRLDSLRFESWGVTALGNLLAEQEEYEQARVLLQRGRELKEKLGNRYSIAISISSLAYLESRQENLETALEFHNEALKIYKEIGAIIATFRKLRDIGVMHYNQGRYTEAVVAHEEARTLGLKMETPLELASTLIYLAQTYAQLHRHDDTLTAYHDSLALLETLDEKDLSRVGLALQGIGEVYEDSQRSLEEARSYYERAREALVRPTDASQLATTLLRLAGVYASLGNHKASLTTYEERLRLLDSLPERDPHRVGITLSGIAQVYKVLEEHEDAVHYYKLARGKLLEAGSEDELLEVLLSLGQVYTELKDYDNSLAIYKEGLEMANSLTDEDARLKGSILYKMGTVCQKLERLDEALEYFEQAREVIESVEAPIDLIALLGTLAETYEAVGQEDKATEARAAAETILTGLAESEDTAALLTVASYFLDQGELERAQAAVDRADLLLIEQSRAGQSTETETESLGRLYHRLGRAHESREEYDNSLTNYQKAISLLDSSANPQLYGVVLHDIGDVYRAQKQLEQALTSYEEARKYKAKGPNRRSLAITLQVLADVHVDLGQHEEGLTIYEEAVKELDS